MQSVGSSTLSFRFVVMPYLLCALLASFVQFPRIPSLIALYFASRLPSLSVISEALDSLRVTLRLYNMHSQLGRSVPTNLPSLNTARWAFR